MDNNPTLAALTDAEIEAADDYRILRLIAFITGWSNLIANAFGGTGAHLLGTSPAGEVASPVPNWPTDLNDAVTLGEEAKRLGIAPIFGAYLFNLQIVSRKVSNNLYRIVEIAHLPARARCNAFLKAARDKAREAKDA